MNHTKVCKYYCDCNDPELKEPPCPDPDCPEQAEKKEICQICRETVCSCYGSSPKEPSEEWTKRFDSLAAPLLNKGSIIDIAALRSLTRNLLKKEREAAIGKAIEALPRVRDNEDKYDLGWNQALEKMYHALRQLKP